MIRQTDDIQEVVPLIERWCRGNRADDFGFHTSAHIAQADVVTNMRTLGDQSALFVDGDPATGCLFMFVVPNYLNDNLNVAMVKYWYSINAHSGPKLFKAATEWAKEQKAAHIVVCASHMMPQNHDAIADYCIATGMLPFETSFIKEIP